MTGNISDMSAPSPASFSADHPAKRIASALPNFWHWGGRTPSIIAFRHQHCEPHEDGLRDCKNYPNLRAIFLVAIAFCPSATEASAGFTEYSYNSTVAADLLHRTVTVELPKAPAPYDLPAASIRVTNGPELETALAKSKKRNIILADGEYEIDGFFKNVCGNRLFAENLGGAVLRSGISVGGNQCDGGAVIQGLVFDVDDPKKTLFDQIITIWGTGKNTLLMDLTINGHNEVEYGVMIRQAEGAVLKRIVARNFQSGGVKVHTNKPGNVISTPVIIEDINVEHVSRPTPRSSNGTAEACIWVGEPAVARRFKMRNCAWMGLWTGLNTNGSLFSDLDIDISPVGVYAEHKTRNTTFERMQIGPVVGTGVNCEWGGPEREGIGACNHVVIQDSVLNTTCRGVGFNPGTQWSTVRRTRFENQRAFAVSDWNGIENLWDTTGNDYSQIADTAVSYYAASPRKLMGVKCH